MVSRDASIPKQYVILGETGQGKSLFIHKTFKSLHPCKIGRGRGSQTLLVDPYYPSKSTPDAFKNCVFFDTIGFLDTEI